MPRVRMLTSVSGSDVLWQAGEIIDMSDTQARTWADGERAELVEGEITEDQRPRETPEDQTMVEQEIQQPPENRARRTWPTR